MIETGCVFYEVGIKYLNAVQVHLNRESVEHVDYPDQQDQHAIFSLRTCIR